MRAFLLAALLACSPTQRYALRRCPTHVTILGDFVAGTAALAVSVLAYSSGRAARAATYGGVGMLIYLGANEAECRR